MLSKIVYEKLFSMFDYQIELKNGGVTVITGPNGFGKSTILKSIDAFSDFDVMFFGELEFKKIDFYSSDFKEPVCIRKSKTGITINDFEINIDLLNQLILRKVKRPYYYSIDGESWIDRRTDEVFTKEGLIETFLKSNSLEETDELDITKITELKNKLKEYSGETKFIKEQRLLKEERLGRFETKTISVIEELPIKFLKN